MDGNPSRLERGLYAVDAIVASLPVDPKEDRGVGLFCEALDAQIGALFVMGEDRTRLVARSVWHRGTPAPADLSYPVKGQGAFARVFREREPRALSRTAGRAILEGLGEHLNEVLGFGLIVPLAKGGDVASAMLLARTDEVGSFTAEEVTTARILSSVASLASEHLGLRDEATGLRQKVAQLDAQLLQSAKLAVTGKLAASIAHEINNPLQSVQSCIYLVNDGVPADGPSRQYLDIAREELDRIARIVQRLADLYRPAQDSARPTDLNTLIENVLVLTGKRLQQGKVNVTRSFAPDLPLITTSADQMRQVFLNLILNAVEAMPDGGELQVMTRTLRKHPAFVEVVFKDSGVGIAPDAMGRVFDPFYSTKARGTGLGLSISHDIVERHGGSIRVESGSGTGSLFTVSLPAPGAESARRPGSRRRT